MKTTQLQFKRDVGYSIAEELHTHGTFALDPDAVFLLAARVEEALTKSVTANQNFIRLRLNDEDIELILSALAGQLDVVQQSPLLDHLNEAYTRLICVQPNEEPIAVVGVLTSPV